MFGRKVAIATPEVDNTLTQRLDSMQQTLDGFAAAFGSLQERIDSVEAAASLRMDRLGDDAKQTDRVALHVYDAHAQLAEQVDIHSQTLTTFSKALDDLRRDSAVAKDKIRENEIAIQQVARQRSVGGGIAGIV
jgi:phage shock protein A